MISKKFSKILGLTLSSLVITSMLVGCGKSTDQATGSDKNTEEQITLKYWTWFPSSDQYKETIEKYESTHPNVKIELNVMESKAFQEKVPVALATDEEIDIVGVQPTAMAGQIKDYLADLDPLMKEVAGDDWTSKYSTENIATAKSMTSDTLKFLPLVNAGSMIGYYNVKMFKEYGLEVPKTLEDYKKLAETLKTKNKDILPAVYAGKEAWVTDEMMLTVMGQTSDYLDQWRYKGAKVDDPHFIKAINDFKKFYDTGVFTKDVMDLDYGKSYEMFATGKAATFFQGTWEGGLISDAVRKSKQINLEDVGVFALPVVDPNGKASLRSFIDVGAAVVKNSKHQKEAADFLAYITFGEGIDILAKQFIGTPGKVGFKMDESLLTSQAAKDGWKLMTDLVQNPTADRNNVSAYSDVQGAAVQKVLIGQSKAEDVVKELQKDWESGKYTIN